MEHLRNHLEILQLELKQLDEQRTELQAAIDLIIWELKDNEEQEKYPASPIETQVPETQFDEPDVPVVVIATTAEQFYLNGDIGKNEEEQYCTIRLLPDNFKCDRTFWGVLLGYMSDSNLWVMHLDAWIRWSLVVHKNFLKTETSRRLTSYAVMPTVFHDWVLEKNWDLCVKLANGSKAPYLSWLYIDTVLIPIKYDSTWFMFEFKIQTNKLTVYTRELKSIPREHMTFLTTFYKENISKIYNLVKYGSEEVNTRDAFVSLKPVKSYRGSKQHSGVFICMFIHYLLNNEKEDVITGDIVKGEVTKFRKLMADIFYAKRRD